MTEVPAPEASEAAPATDLPPPEDSAEAAYLWRRPERLGHQENMKGLGGVVAPLLAGFALSTIAILATADHHPRLWQPAILAFAAGASFLLYAMQVAFYALQYYATPADWLSWYPEATVNTATLNQIRALQARDHERVKTVSKRYANAYERGLLGLLAGLWLLVWPRFPAHGAFPVWQVGALVAVGAALLTEVWWMAARLHNRSEDDKPERNRNRWHHPALWDDVREQDVADVSPTALASVLDPERRHATGRWFPDLTHLPPDR